MEALAQAEDLGIASRLTRSRGRSPRDQNANARLTKRELATLQDAAKAEGKALGEWTRDVLLREVGAGSTERALFTELIALRLLLNSVLRAVVLRDPMTREQYQAVLTEIRTTKHEAARDVLAQYQPASVAQAGGE